MDKITSPLDDRIQSLYGKPVSMTVETFEITPFGQDTLRTTHEGILVRRSLFGDDENVDTVEFYFSMNMTAVILDIGQFNRASASFIMTPILPL